METDLNVASAQFSKIFSSVLNNHAPLKIFQNRKNYAPYLSDTLKQEMSVRNKLKQQSIYSSDPGKLREYKILRNRIKSKLKNEKTAYYNKKLSECLNDANMLWKTSYQILGQNRDLSPKQIVYDGNLISSPLQLAEAFNKIFCDKVQKVKADIVDYITTAPVERLRLWLSTTELPIFPLDLSPINHESLRSYVKQLKGGRSSGIDDIDSFSLKLSAPLIEDVLLHLVNRAIKNGSFADSWKTQLVYPYYKKGDRCIGENYRPASNIPEISKLVEYAVHEQLLKHFQDNCFTKITMDFYHHTVP